MAPDWREVSLPAGGFKEMVDDLQFILKSEFSSAQKLRESSPGMFSLTPEHTTEKKSEKLFLEDIIKSG